MMSCARINSNLSKQRRNSVKNHPPGIFDVSCIEASKDLKQSRTELTSLQVEEARLVREVDVDLWSCSADAAQSGSTFDPQFQLYFTAQLFQPFLFFSFFLMAVNFDHLLSTAVDQDRT